jgi:hypothetical protein
VEHRALIGREIPLRVLSDALAAPPAVILLVAATVQTHAKVAQTHA